MRILVAISILLVSLLVWQELTQSKKSIGKPSTEKSAYKGSHDTVTSETVTSEIKDNITLYNSLDNKINHLMTTTGLPRHYFDKDLLLLVDAFENESEYELSKIIYTLLEVDVSTAINTLSKIDNILSLYNTTFPFDTVANYLNTHFSSAEIMELLSDKLEFSFAVQEVSVMIYQDWSIDDFVELQDWITQNKSFHSSYFIDRYLSEAVEMNSVDDTLSFINYMESDDPRRDEMYQRILEKWAVASPENFANFMSQTLEGDFRADRALKVLAIYKANEGSVDAMNWANTISNHQLRQEAIIASARQLIKKNSVAFNEWLKQSNYGDKNQRRLIIDEIKCYAEAENHYDKYNTLNADVKC